MSLQYDKIGGHYNSVKTLPLDLVQTANAVAQIGNIEGLSVLDLACGSGYYARKAIDLGASRVVGLDISPAMIEAARREFSDTDADHHRRLQFHVADCCKPLPVAGDFDVVFAMWFLNYASTAETQTAMWRNIFTHLKPGGRCIGIIPNFNRFKTPEGEGEDDDGERFGSRMQVVHTVPGGVKYRCSLAVNPPVSFEGYLLSREIYETCARSAGFVSVQWLDPVDPGVPGLDFAAIPRHLLCQVFEARRALE
ncbi:hypothetical protein BDW75DRAFT_197898 [Aspergillus navahoensis]